MLIRTNQEYDKIILDALDKKLSFVEFSMKDIMNHGHGRFVNATSFGIINKFYENKTNENKKINFNSYLTNRKGNIELTHDQLISLIYTSKEKNKSGDIKQAKTGVIGFQNYYLNTDSLDYAKRSLVFGSSQAKLDTDNIRYIIDSFGNPVGIKNLSISILQDNYDYKSSNIPQLVNTTLNHLLSGNNNHTVSIIFKEDRTDREKFSYIDKNTFLAIKKEQKKNVKISTIPNISSMYNRGVELLNHRCAKMPYMHSSFIYRKDNNYFDSLEHKFAETANRLTTTMSGLPNIVNTVSFSAQPNPKLDANSDAVVISRSRKAIVNKHTLNQHSDPASVAKSSIITDDMRVLIKTRSNLLNS